MMNYTNVMNSSHLYGARDSHSKFSTYVPHDNSGNRIRIFCSTSDYSDTELSDTPNVKLTLFSRIYLIIDRNLNCKTLSCNRCSLTIYDDQ